MPFLIADPVLVLFETGGVHEGEHRVLECELLLQRQILRDRLGSHAAGKLPVVLFELLKGGEFPLVVLLLAKQSEEIYRIRVIDQVLDLNAFPQLFHIAKRRFSVDLESLAAAQDLIAILLRVGGCAQRIG